MGIFDSFVTWLKDVFKPLIDLYNEDSTTFFVGAIFVVLILLIIVIVLARRAEDDEKKSSKKIKYEDIDWSVPGEEPTPARTEAAAIAVKERLLNIRERIINGERFATLARLYSEDPGSARKGGELGMASKTIFWPAFSDAAMSLKPGTISQIVETPDGFHIIEVLEKKGDMFNARHILIRPSYTMADQEKAFHRLDSLRTAILDSTITFEAAARFYSEDAPTRTNGGQMADPHTGSAYFEIDQLKPQDYAAIQDLKVGEISEPIASLDNEGRDGNLVYKIIRLDKIVPAHTATFETDYTDLLSQVQQEKVNVAIRKFLDDKIESSYIIIDPLFGDCDFSRKGWSAKVRKDD